MNLPRFAIHPTHFKKLSTEETRDAFLIQNLFQKDLITFTYTHYDRMIIGGVHPVSQSIKLYPIAELKADFFLQRREIGIINVGDPGSVRVDRVSFKLQKKDALYIGKNVKDVVFEKPDQGSPLFYFNSTPAHTSYPTCKVTTAEAETVEMGEVGTANLRTIRKLLVNSVLPTCQLQMGLTELKPGSVWNTMPQHTYDRRMEVYLYFDLPPN